MSNRSSSPLPARREARPAAKPQEFLTAPGPRVVWASQTPVCDGQSRARAPAGESPSSPPDASAPAAALVAVGAFDPELVQSVLSYASNSRAPRTHVEYAKHWSKFCAWCAEAQLCALPAAAQTLALFLAARADEGLKVATLNVAISAITCAHRGAGHPSPADHPLVQQTWRGIRRRLGVAQEQKHPIAVQDLRRMIDALPCGLLGQRDRALITLGFAGAFRRSELVALDVRDLRFAPEGLEVLVRRSKSDQEGRGLLKVVAYGSDPATCPVRSAKDWLELASIAEGPVFRALSRHERLGARLSDHAIAVIVKRAAKRVGLSVEPLAGHSLRAGFVTTAKLNGADDAAIMDQTGHKSLAMIHTYVRRTKKWSKPASAKLGL